MNATFFSVCIKFLQKFEKTLTDADRKDENVLTEKLKTACGKAKNKENRFVSFNIYIYKLNIYDFPFYFQE